MYRARDTRLDRTVALKVLAGSLTSDEPSRARFQREAKAISALNHPHICALYDLGRTDGIDFLVLELLQGDTLAARLARGSVPLSQVLTRADPPPTDTCLRTLRLLGAANATRA